MENMPPGVKMVFSGFEVGVRVLSGGVLTSCAPEANPCRQAYIDYSGEGVDRFSWDPLTLVAAVRNLDEIGFVLRFLSEGKSNLLDLFYSCEETGQNGKNEIDEDGGNFWYKQVDGGSNQTYLLLHVSCSKTRVIMTLPLYCFRMAILEEKLLMN